MSKLQIFGKITKYTAFAVIFSILLSGCSIWPKKKTVQADPDVNRIVVWSFEDEDVWKGIKKKFESTYKGYTLEYQKQTFSADYESRAVNSILSTQKPDVWAMPSDWVYRHKEKLYPMPTALAQKVDLDNRFVPSLKQSIQFNDQIYAFSPSAEPLIVFYNPDIFKQTEKELKEDDREYYNEIKKLLDGPPTLWADFAEAATVMTKTDGDRVTQSGAALGTKNVSYAQDILYLLMLQNETDILSNEMNLATFNLPKKSATGEDENPGVRAMDFYTSFADPMSENYTWSDDLGNSVDAFAQGKVAMLFGYNSIQNYLTQKYPNFSYKKAFAPQLNQDAGKITDLARFPAFGVSKLSKAPSVSWGLVYEILSQKQASNFNSATRLYTAKKATSYDISIESRESNNPEKLTLATARSIIKGRYPVEFDEEIKKAIGSVNEGNQDAKGALDLAASNITEYLRKTSW